MCSKFADLAIVPRSIVKHCIHAGCAEHALRDDSFFYADDAPWKVARRHLCGPDAIVQGDSAPPQRAASKPDRNAKWKYRQGGGGRGQQARRTKQK